MKYLLIKVAAKIKQNTIHAVPSTVSDPWHMYNKMEANNIFDIIIIIITSKNKLGATVKTSMQFPQRFPLHQEWQYYPS